MERKTKKIVCILYFSLLFCTLSAYAQTNETVTILTYYPSPYGVYNALQAQKMAVGDNTGDNVLTSADLPPSNGDLIVGNTLTVRGLFHAIPDCTVIASAMTTANWAVAQCPPGDWLLTGGAVCDAVSGSMLQSSVPDFINMNWRAWCQYFGWGPTSGTGQAFAVCCKRQ